MSGNRELLFDELEREARQRSEALESNGKLPPGFTAEHYPMTRSELRESRRLNACLELADNADTFVALAKGRSVPRSWLTSRLAAFVQRR